MGSKAPQPRGVTAIAWSSPHPSLGLHPLWSGRPPPSGGRPDHFDDERPAEGNFASPYPHRETRTRSRLIRRVATAISLPLLELSTLIRAGGEQWFAVGVAAFGIVITTHAGLHFQKSAIPGSSASSSRDLLVYSV